MHDLLHMKPLKSKDFSEPRSGSMSYNQGVSIGSVCCAPEMGLHVPQGQVQELFEAHDDHCEAYFYGDSLNNMTFSAWRNMAGEHIHIARNYNRKEGV